MERNISRASMVSSHHGISVPIHFRPRQALTSPRPQSFCANASQLEPHHICSPRHFFWPSRPHALPLCYLGAFDQESSPSLVLSAFLTADTWLSARNEKMANTAQWQREKFNLRLTTDFVLIHVFILSVPPRMRLLLLVASLCTVMHFLARFLPVALRGG